MAIWSERGVREVVQLVRVFCFILVAMEIHFKFPPISIRIVMKKWYEEERMGITETVRWNVHFTTIYILITAINNYILHSLKGYSLCNIVKCNSYYIQFLISSFQILSRTF